MTEERNCICALSLPQTVGLPHTTVICQRQMLPLLTVALGSRLTSPGRLSAVPSFLRPRGPYPTRLPAPWAFPGKDAGVGCRFLPRGSCSSQGSNLRLPRWPLDSSPLEPPGKPYHSLIRKKYSNRACLPFQRGEEWSEGFLIRLQLFKKCCEIKIVSLPPS